VISECSDNCAMSPPLLKVQSYELNRQFGYPEPYQVNRGITLNVGKIGKRC
jgi:hypothetical protein